MTALERAIAAVSLFIARLTIPLLVVLGAWLVPGRHLRFGPDADLKEMMALAFFVLVMGSFGYAYLSDAHVRVDLASRRMAARTRAVIELAGCVAVLMPICAILIWYGGDAAWRSYLQAEHLAMSDLPLQWLVRLAVPASALLLLAAAVCVCARCVRILLGERSAGPRD
ncbi:MAG TPA: TRAP transporter small permease subunit [Burkholderiales bacterium]|jgi:TRAP-type mannitol/chloroaromatic compound transport system permease small subunit|nr:TRAP transporter small permease subunit [Burkholderiales bacterium]